MPALPGLVTVTVTVPDVAMAVAGTVTVSWLPLTKVVFGLGGAVPVHDCLGAEIGAVDGQGECRRRLQSLRQDSSCEMAGMVPATGVVVLAL